MTTFTAASFELSLGTRQPDQFHPFVQFRPSYAGGMIGVPVMVCAKQTSERRMTIKINNQNIQVLNSPPPPYTPSFQAIMGYRAGTRESESEEVPAHVLRAAPTSR